MKYNSIEKKTAKQNSRNAAVDAWMSCDTYEEFKMKVATDGIELSTNDSIALAVFHFMREHPTVKLISDALAYIVLFPLSVFVLFIHVPLYVVLLAPTAFMTAMWYTAIITDNPLVMKIKWTEDGKPIDY